MIAKSETSQPSPPVKTPHAPRRIARKAISAAYYDAANAAPINSAHWSGATTVDAGAAIRGSLVTLRNRARREVANNSIARGLVDTQVAYIVGTGPKLQISTQDADLDTFIENAWAKWSQHCDLTGQMCLADMIGQWVRQDHECGESLTLMTSDQAGDGPVTLRLETIEPDRLETPYKLYNDEGVRDGVRYDASNRPTRYFIAKAHPGDTTAGAAGLWGEYIELPAQFVIHQFEATRPNQGRGVPRLAPALHTLGLMRDLNIAAITAAKRAASISGALETADPSVDPDGDQSQDEFDEIELPEDALLVLPYNRKLSQVKAEHPTSNHAAIIASYLNDAARCLNMPYNIAACNSSGYNYSSGRLDHQSYFRWVGCYRCRLEFAALRRILTAFLRELAYTRPIRNIASIVATAQWFWQGFGFIDPATEAKAQGLRLANRTSTLAREYAEQGRDWERDLRQIAREQALLRELGLTPEQAQPAEAGQQNEGQDDA